MSRIALHWQILAGMLLGAAIGLSLNFTASDRQHTVPQDELPPGISYLEFHDTPNRIDIIVEADGGERRHRVVDGTRSVEGAVATLEKLTDTDSQSYDQQAHDLFHQHGRSWARWIGDGAHRLGKLFLRMLQMVAVPLIVTSLTTGVLGLGHAERLGRMFGRTLAYYLVTSMLAIVTGLVMVNLIRPGLKDTAVAEPESGASVSGTLSEVLFNQVETMIPANPIGALAAGNFLSIICFSLLFAIFTILVGGKTCELIRSFFNAAFDVMMAMTLAIIKLAPIGVLLLMMYVTATQGTEVFKSLAWYMVAVLCALVFHASVTLPAILWFVARRPPVEFLRAMSPALLTAFSSASSNGTLPLTWPVSSYEQESAIV